MPIQFPCDECGHLLETPDDTAGKLARCPRCRSVRRVPLGDASFGSTGPSAGEAADGVDGAGVASGRGAAEKPDAFGKPAPEPLRKPVPSLPEKGDVAPRPAPQNPFASPHADPRRIVTAAMIRSRVQLPAICMAMVAISQIVLLALSMLGHLTSLVVDRQAAAFHEIGLLVLIGGVNAVILVGSVRMFQMRNHGLATAAGLLCLLPCQCCCATAPIGIWVLVALGGSGVKTHFQ